MVKVTLYTRAGCCLCEEAKQVLETARRRVAFEFEEIDIDRHPEWLRLYTDEVPVIAIEAQRGAPPRAAVQERNSEEAIAARGAPFCASSSIGRKTFKYRVSLDEILKELAARA
jgi:glutaredoxin